MNAIAPKLTDAIHRQFTLDLGTLSLIEVTGADAASFLQGQFSNDVATIGQLQCQLNAYCTPKGRMLALIKLIRHGDDFWLVVPTELAEPLTKRLKMFVLRAAVCIEMKPQTTLIGLLGGDDGLRHTDMDAAGIVRIPIDGIHPRQLLLGAKQAMATWLHSCQYTHESQDDLWRLCDILSGIPQIYPQTVEQFIPQTLNLDLLDGLSFTKGCYPGQEIVARLRYLGKLKQRMLVGRVQGLATLLPGERIYLAPADSAPQKVGMVVDAVQTDHHEYTFSATAPVDMLEPDLESSGILRVGDASGPAARVLPLPYATSPS